jgi:Tfp pilus assembly protein PilF
MTEALIAELAQLEGLRVISRTSAMHYRDHTKLLPAVAAELGADMIVEGSVRRSGDRVRITAQLIDARSDHHLWAKNYEHTLRDVLKLQAQVASEIVKVIKGALTPLHQVRLAERRAVDPAVYDLYLRGRHAWNQRTPDGFATVVTHFEQAIERDPAFALAYAGLSDVYVLPSTRPSLGAPANLAAAEESFRRAITLNPGYATARQWYAILLSEQGRDNEALAQAREAVALDPLAGPIRQASGLVHYYGRRFAQAVTEARRAIELAPQLPLARTIVAKGLFFQAAYREAADAAEAVSNPRGPDAMAILGLALLRAGDKARADTILNELVRLEPFPVVPLAQWYAATGDTNEAFRILARTATPGAQPFVGIDPLFDGIRNDARFRRLVAADAR